MPAVEQAISRQAYAGLLWSEQFYHYVVPDWINGDAKLPLPPEVREKRINRDWPHLFSRDVLSVPDKWEYPAFFAWDLAFHMIPMARIDPDCAKKQLLLLLREWYLHPNGQLPAFEYDFSNVNPPVHAWACWQVFERTGGTDHAFLERAFHKLLMNFTWWVNRKDPEGRNVFSGGFLGMDNLGVFDRSRPLPTGGQLEQADGTAWMGFYCTSMLRIALELALHHNRAYEDVASKFLEHFIFISDSLNNLGGRGLWDEEDGFYYDQLLIDGRSTPLKLRALIGLIPLLAVQVLDEDVIRQALPEFSKRAEWFLANRKDLIKRVAEIEIRGVEPHRHLLLSLPGRDRLERALRYLLDEQRVLIAAWRPVVVASVQGSPVRIPRGRRRSRVPGRLRSRRHGLPAVRWELELAWAGVVPDQLPPDRGSARVPPLLRGYLPDRMPDRIGPVRRPRWRGTRARGAARLIVRATGGPAAAVPRLLRTLRERPALA